MNILVITILIVLPLTISLSKTKPTTKYKITPKKTSTKIEKTTKSNQNKLTQCYEGRGSIVPCNTSCLYYSQIENNIETRGISCSSENECPGDYYVASPGFVLKYGCCTTDLCNSIEYANKSLNYNCMPDIPHKKLLFPLFNPRLSSVKQCYDCKSCVNPEKETKITDCKKSSSSDKFACSYFYYNLNNTKYQTMGCYLVKNQTFSFSYKNSLLKGTICQADLCNSLKNMAILENATLCSDGYYI